MQLRRHADPNQKDSYVKRPPLPHGLGMSEDIIQSFVSVREIRMNGKGITPLSSQ